MRNVRKQCKPWKFERAREMRKNQTPAEMVLWQRLRRKGLGVKFWRQAVILGWIADFYCPKKNIIVEVDGGYHVTRQEADAVRDRVMTERGFTVIRFTNEQVFSDLPTVLAKIRQIAQEPA